MARGYDESRSPGDPAGRNAPASVNGDGRARAALGRGRQVVREGGEYAGGSGSSGHGFSPGLVATPKDETVGGSRLSAVRGRAGSGVWGVSAPRTSASPSATRSRAVRPGPS